jgi:hypothetical protein
LPNYQEKFARARVSRTCFLCQSLTAHFPKISSIPSTHPHSLSSHLNPFPAIAFFTLSSIGLDLGFANHNHSPRRCAAAARRAAVVLAQFLLNDFTGCTQTIKFFVHSLPPEMSRMYFKHCFLEPVKTASGCSPLTNE